MTRKKGGFLTFIFSLLPGAGDMYMGFFKHGVSLMILFFATCAASAMYSSGFIMTLAPVIWFYGFFRVHNINSLSDEKFNEIEDKFIFEDTFIREQIFAKEKSRKIFAAILIVLGASALWKTMENYIYNLAGVLNINLNWLAGFVSEVPAIVISIGLILFGIYLIKGKKEELDVYIEGGNTDGEDGNK